MFRLKRTKTEIIISGGLVLFFCLASPLAFAATPTLGTILPSSGTTTPDTAKTFNCQYSDTSGWAHLKEAYLLISTSSSTLTNSVYLYYDQNTNKLYLRNDANTSWLGGYAPGTSNTIENSYVKVNCVSTTFSGSSSTLTVNWNITFKPAYSGKSYISYLKAVDDASVQVNWTQKGNWTVNRSPLVGTITPSSGSCIINTAKTFITTYSDQDGWQNIQYVYFLVNTSTSGSNCLYAYYNQNTNTLYLRNDANTSWLGGYAPGSSNTIENSYAKLNCASTTVSGTTTVMTVNWSVVFKSTFTGSKNTYLYVMDDVNTYQDWQQKGTWSISQADTTPPTGTIKINNDAAYTNSTSVTLTLSAADSGSGMGSGAQMQFSNDNSTWSTAETYATTKTWTLASGDGTKTVYVKYKDAIGNWSGTFLDTITLDKTTPTGTIKINNDAAYTNSTSVTLTLSATDTGSGLSQMQFSNDNSTWSTTETYATSKTWSMSSGDGSKTVYAKFKDNAGNWSVSFSDTIILDATLPTGSILINNGDVSVDNWDVTLTLSASDSGSGMGNGAQMQFSSDSSNWSTPEAYSVTKSWKLTSGFGTRTVYAKFKDAVGNWSVPISDTINVINIPKERIYIYFNGKRIAMEENGKKSFYHNDHLGGTNIITDESGTQVKFIDYKPFGETKVEEGSLKVKKKFTGKELDDSTGLYDYAARMYDAKLGRFITADPIEFSDTGIKLAGGTNLEAFLINPQNLNRYSYCLNNPIRFIDPDGLLTILIHGTYSNQNMFSKEFIKNVNKTFNEQHATVSLKWSGKNSDKARVEAAKSLARLINKFNFLEGEKLNIVAHSHGGNVVFLTSQLKLLHKIDTLVTLGTPIREYQPNMENIGKIYNAYSTYDTIQISGGSKHKPFGQEFGPAGRTLKNAQNINIPVDKIDTHGYLHSESVWKTYIHKEINKDN